MIEINRVKLEDASHTLIAINKLLPQLHPSGKAEVLTLEGLRECLNNKNFYLFVIGDVARSHMRSFLGMGSVFFQKNLGRWIAEIHDIVVDGSMRGEGLGEKIVLRLIEETKTFAAKRQKQIKLYLTSRPSRVAANKLYIKLGFVLVAKAKGEWGTNLYKMVIKP